MRWVETQTVCEHEKQSDHGGWSVRAKRHTLSFEMLPKSCSSDDIHKNGEQNSLRSGFFLKFSVIVYFTSIQFHWKPTPDHFRSCPFLSQHLEIMSFFSEVKLTIPIVTLKE